MRAIQRRAGRQRGGEAVMDWRACPTLERWKWGTWRIVYLLMVPLQCESTVLFGGAERSQKWSLLDWSMVWHWMWQEAIEADPALTDGWSQKVDELCFDNGITRQIHNSQKARSEAVSVAAAVAVVAVVRMKQVLIRVS
jgi:hypothetical protein